MTNEELEKNIKECENSLEVLEKVKDNGYIYAYLQFRQEQIPDGTVHLVNLKEPQFRAVTSLLITDFKSRLLGYTTELASRLKLIENGSTDNTEELSGHGD